MYPNSLHIIGAIHRAQRAGHLPMWDRSRLRATGEERKALDRIAFEKTMTALHALGIAISKQSEQESHPGISLVIIEEMLWTRFSTEFFDVRQGLHAKGPVAGDVVLVTDEPVVSSIREGSMSIDRALELGVMRVYASEWQKDALIDQFGSIGEAPLPRPDVATSSHTWLFDQAPRPDQTVGGSGRSLKLDDE